MHNYYPILWVGAIIGVISTLLIVAAFVVKDGELSLIHISEPTRP